MRGGGPLHSIARAAVRAAARGVKPSRLGVHGYRAVVKARLAASLAAPMASTALYWALGPLGLLGGLALLAIAVAAPSIYRYMLASGLEREAPALLAYMLPFAWTSKGLVDVIASLQSWRGRPFNWVRREAARLTVRLRLGADPITALEWLAETTPSKTLAAALRDYTHALRLGVPRSAVAQRLLDSAIDAMKASWRSYVSLARAAAEAAAALTVLVAALAPAAALSSIDPSLLSALLAAPAALTIVLVAGQPSLGLPQTPLMSRVAPLAVAGAASLLAASGYIYVALALLASAALLVEAYARLVSGRQSRAWASLSRAIEKARLGLIVEDDLKEAAPAAPGVLDALIESSRIAGTKGLTKALQGIYGIIAEARSLARSYSVQSLLMSIVAAAAAVIAVYAVDSLSQLSQVGHGLIDPAMISAIGGILLATSPLAPLPAAAASRPWAPTMVPSLAALAASLYVAGVIDITSLLGILAGSG